MRMISKLLMIVGLIIFIFPLAGQGYALYQQRQLVGRWERLTEESRQAAYAEESSLSGATVKTDSSGYAEDAEEFPGIFTEYPETQPFESVIPEPSQVPKTAPSSRPEQSERTPAKASPDRLAAQKVLGILTIKSIKLKVPVVEGVEAENLTVAAGHMPGTAGIGEAGNAVVVGHRNYTFAQYFKNLDKLDKGDLITIAAKDRVFTYRVTGKLIVEPDDISVLAADNTERKLTLITCHPYVGSTHRLVVYALLEGEEAV